MNIIKNIIKACTPRGTGMSATHLYAAFYFGIVGLVVSNQQVIGTWGYIDIANILSLILLILTADYVSGGIKAAQMGVKHTEATLIGLMKRVKALERAEESMFKMFEEGARTLNEKMKREEVETKSKKPRKVQVKHKK